MKDLTDIEAEEVARKIKVWKRYLDRNPASTVGRLVAEQLIMYGIWASNQLAMPDEGGDVQDDGG